MQTTKGDRTTTRKGYGSPEKLSRSLYQILLIINIPGVPLIQNESAVLRPSTVYLLKGVETKVILAVI